MWYKTMKQVNREIEDVLNGNCGDSYKDVDMITGPDKDKFLEEMKSIYEPVLFTENYALVRLPKDFVSTYNVNIIHVKSFQKS